MYGDKPVVQLTLRCEDIFFHKWERPLMPKVVADAMAGVQPVGGGPPKASSTNRFNDPTFARSAPTPAGQQ